MSFRTITLAALLLLVTTGTGYSIYKDTALDTSSALLANLPRADTKAYFAQKSNILNVVFVKKAWGWTTAAFLAVYLTSPPELVKAKRLGQWAAATLVWAAFTSWFFGPGLFERFNAASGAQCVVHIPSEFAGTDARSRHLVVADEYCRTRTLLSPSTHPKLFTDPTIISSLAETSPTFQVRPHLYHGHDVSGHLFLLTLSALFLADQITPSLPLVFPSIFSYTPSSRVSKPTALHMYTIRAAVGLLGIWLFMALTTSVYFHTPYEKLSGLAIGLAGYAMTKAVVSSSSASPARSPTQTPAPAQGSPAARPMA